MGMIACYMEADEGVIEGLLSKTDEDLFEDVESFSENNNKSYDMDKLWDGLHYVLTKTSATTPIEDDLLSEAIVGMNMFSDDEDSDFIAYIHPERVREISIALSNFDIDNALSNFSPNELASKGIYPAIWVESEKESLKKELLSEFEGLKDFYDHASKNNKGVIVSIY